MGGINAYGEILYKYDPNMSNAKWTVFSKSMSLTNTTYYRAIKNDYSEYIEWWEPDREVIDGQTFGRNTYKRISKEELIKMSFVGKRSFLQ